jgi:hypothetical protein
MNMADYPHFNRTEDGRICSIGQHYPRFPRMLYDTLLSLKNKSDTPIYHCWLSMAHDMEVCEASMMIPIDPLEP